MNKILTILFTIFLNQAFAQVSISGTVKSGDIVYLQKFQDKLFKNVDSVKVKNGKFEFKNPKIDTPELYGLTVSPKSSPTFLFIDKEDKNIIVELDSSSRYKNTLISGSSAQKIYNEYLTSDENFSIENFVKSNPNSVAAAYVLYRNYSYRLEPNEINEYIAFFSSDIQKTPYIKALKEHVKILENVAIGKIAPDFTQTNVNEEPVQFSSLWGKYILVDFWAAWCGPCRKENPNVVEAYTKFKDKGFDVLGISLDRSKEAWIKAIEKDNLTWTQLSDLNYWQNQAAILYGVRAIPANFLIDPQGKIIAKNLKGKELHQYLEQLFSETK